MMSKKKSKAPSRRNIYIPPELSERMAKQKDENWSAVACAAFESRMAEIAKKRIEEKGAKEMEDVIERLRASKIEAETEGYADGVKAGEKWAMEEAEVRDLRSLERFRKGIRDHEWSDYFEAGESAFTPAEQLAMAILGDAAGRGEAADFWEGEAGDDWEAITDSAAYLKGFAEGALDVWREVKDKI